MGPLGRLLRLFGRPDGLPAASWDVFGASWGSLAGLEGVFKRSGAVLRASWEPLGAFWGGFGSVLGRLGAALPAKTEKTKKNNVLDPFWEPKTGAFGMYSFDSFSICV